MSAHRAYLTHDNGIWTVWAADVCGSATGVPLGYLTDEYEEWNPEQPDVIRRKGFKISLVGDGWRNQVTGFSLFKGACRYILDHHHYADIKAEFI